MDSNKPAPKRRRARKADGTYKGNDPTTPDLNEAWEPTEVTPALPKKSYMKPPKIEGPSNNTAGRYAKKPRVNRPGIGNAHTKYN